MCLIMQVPAGKVIDQPLESILRTAGKGNPDGYGFMYFDKKPIVEKGLATGVGINKFLQINPKFERAIHFRWGTHGATTLANCHPFPMHTWYMMHNGVFPEFAQDKTVSDSKMFAKHLGANLIRWKSVKLEEFLKTYCGWNNRLLLMSDVGKMTRIGVWHMEEGVWLSNTYSTSLFTLPTELKELSPESAKQFIVQNPNYVLSLIANTK